MQTGARPRSSHPAGHKLVPSLSPDPALLERGEGKASYWKAHTGSNPEFWQPNMSPDIATCPVRGGGGGCVQKSLVFENH